MNLFAGAIVICLLVVFFQDLKYRAIHVTLPFVIFILSFLILKERTGAFSFVFLYNVVFFLVTLMLLMLYMSIKNKSFLNPFENYFGLGDLLYFIAITPLFLLKNYILFFIASMLFAILLHSTFVTKTKEASVPLAGFSAALLVIAIVKDMVVDFLCVTII